MLNELIDVTDKIIPEEYPKYFNDEEACELYETCIHMMEEFIKENIFDCWGTYFILAMLAKFLNLTGIESTTYFILLIFVIL